MFDNHLVVFIELSLENLHNLLFPLHYVNIGVLKCRIFLFWRANVMQNLVLLKLSGRTKGFTSAIGYWLSTIKVKLNQ